MESGERSWQSAFREAKEETGLKASELRQLRNFRAYERFSFRRGKDQIFKVVILFLAETRQPNITVSDEHEGYGWFTYSEARKLLSKYQENVHILDTAYNFLKKGSTHSGKHGISHQEPVI